MTTKSKVNPYMSLNNQITWANDETAINVIKNGSQFITGFRGKIKASS